MTESTHLTYEQFLPIATAMQRRDAYTQAGAGFLIPPLPDCPTCGQAPTELVVSSDSYALFLNDHVGIGFRPCGHNFTVDNDDVVNGIGVARYTIAAEEAP